jgi:hypothetical protein
LNEEKMLLTLRVDSFGGGAAAAGPSQEMRAKTFLALAWLSRTRVRGAAVAVAVGAGSWVQGIVRKKSEARCRARS